MEQPLLVFALALFGVALSTYMKDTIDDGSRHIEVNWRRAELCIGKIELNAIEQVRRLGAGFTLVAGLWPELRALRG